MKNLAPYFLALLAFSSLLISCEKDNDDEAIIDESVIKDPQLEVAFVTNTNSTALNPETPTGLSFDSGYIALSELEFEVENDNDTVEVEFEIEMDTRIDFATGISNPDISFVQIPAGTYTELEVEVELNDEDTIPSITLYGTYISTQGDTSVVRFEFNSDEEFEVEKEGIIVLANNQSAIAEITFDPIVWFADVDNAQLDNAVKDSNGVIVINETQNTAIFDLVEDGLELASEVEIKI